ncbi:hypothetical protein [Tenacibaculum sp. nBUS_03]|uniref:hypothetical protein n=1 Tax=Tenacibaculum sp. nBUS_03 TaxID=3395320 RepID=UPI003EB87B90
MRILLSIEDSTEELLQPKNTFITISKKGEIINEKNISFNYSLTDYIESDNGFYTINTLRVTMGKNFTHDFLGKYDEDWKLLWKKELSTHKYPAGNSFLYSYNKDSLVLLTDYSDKKDYGLSLQKFDKEGNLKSKIFNRKYNNPLTVTKTFDEQLLISTLDNEYDSLILLKKDFNNRITWEKSFDKNIFPKQIIQAKDSSFLIYGTEYEINSTKHLTVLKLDKLGGLIWKKTINKNYYEEAGNIIEYGNNFLFSSTITPINDGGDFPYIFELDQNGTLISDKKFNFYLGISSVPYLINDSKTITMITQNWIGEFGDIFSRRNINK